MKVLRYLVPLASLAGVVAVTVWELRTTRTSPGPLHPAHAALAELAGGNACERCHAAGEGIGADRCTACHAPIGRQLEVARGVHGSLEPALARDCARCHPDHHGDAAPLIAAPAFARAGIADPASYAHQHVPGFALNGRHAELACVRCHTHADDVVPPAGGRYLGLSQQCTSCHDDVHRGAYGQGCADCHGQEHPFASLPGFRHETFALRDAHRQVPCASCHEASGAHSVGALRSTPQPARSCAACHVDPHGPDPHGPDPRGPEALLADAPMRIADAADCARCHDETSFAAHRVTAGFHAGFGTVLRGPHAVANCSSCHGDRRGGPRWHDAPPAMDDCRACHDSPHRETLLAADAVRGVQCVECHQDEQPSFSAAELTAAQHARTGFLLTKPHANLDCAACHAQGQPWQQRYPGRAPTDCAACHADPHGGQFAATPAYAQCTACHHATHFLPGRFDVAAHAATAFPLRHQHGGVDCARCHDRDAHGVRRFAGTTTRCADCHRDPHGGRFDRAGVPTTIHGRTDCARCHDERAFRPVATTFDHGPWTGWPLTGAHATVACTQCHERLPQPDASGSRSGKALGTNCADCHRDPHLGQFATDGATDCARCHSTARFAEVRFDHQRDSRFPLDATHARLACSQCHFEVDVGAAKVVRYRPLGGECVDCHGKPGSGGVPARGGRR